MFLTNSIKKCKQWAADIWLEGRNYAFGKSDIIYNKEMSERGNQYIICY